MKKVTKTCKGCRKPFVIEVTHSLCLGRLYCSDACKERQFRKRHPTYRKRQYQKEKEKKVFPALTCKYPSCTTILSDYNKNKDYCLMHQRKILIEQSVVEEEKKLLKSKRWKQLTFWKDSPFFFKSILEGMPRGYSCIAKRKDHKIKQLTYAVFVKTLQKSKGEYINPKKRIYLSAYRDISHS